MPLTVMSMSPIALVTVRRPRVHGPPGHEDHVTSVSADISPGRPYGWPVRGEPVVDMAAWAALLDELLRSSGVTHTWLADEVDVDEKTIGRWRNRKFPPKPENVRDVARALGYPPLHALAQVGFLTSEEAGLTGEPTPVPPPPPAPLRRAMGLLADPRIPERPKNILLRGIDAAIDLWFDSYRARPPREPSAAERSAGRRRTT